MVDVVAMMKKARRTYMPSMPSDIRDLGHKLADFTLMNGFYREMTTSDVDGSTCLVFITDFILEILNNPRFKISHYLWDGTFEASFNQILRGCERIWYFDGHYWIIHCL